MPTYEELVAFVLDLTDGNYYHWEDIRDETGLQEERCRELLGILEIIRHHQP